MQLDTLTLSSGAALTTSGSNNVQIGALLTSGSDTFTVNAPTTLYAGTNDGHVFKSTDAGANWTSIRAGDARVTALAINPATPSTVYLGTSSSGTGAPGLSSCSAEAPGRAGSPDRRA